jgi:nitroimidazol reductase NimA-like FMN-containing flavoprotein (pyridoxamine 5'-phosphate oxidase superfamily)
MEYEKTKTNTVKRGRKKASYDKDVIHAILDDNEICSVAFTIDGKAHVQPINFGRKGECIYLHGSAKNRMTTALIEAGEVCLSVMSLDAMKLTRSAFHHSVKYRSVIVFGQVRELITEESKLEGLKHIINHFIPDRWEYCRHPNGRELKATKVLEITITSASAKIADTPPLDEPEDYATDFWAGTIPVKRVYEQPVPDEKLKKSIKLPLHIQDFYETRNRTP